MATLPLPYLLPTEALRQAARPEALPDYTDLPAALQSVLHFGWQWLHGTEQFAMSTSGSTGSPKRIEVSRQQMLVSIGLTQQALGLSAQHTALLCLNSDFIGGKMMLARALHIGMDLLWVPATAQPLKNADCRADFMAMVPLQVQTVLAENPTLLEGAHAILVGGAPVGTALEESIRTQVQSPVYSTYGMTETLSHIALRRLNGPKASADFRVLGNTQIGTDSRGCLTIRGAITHHAQILTNDLVEVVDERHFRWLGRYDWVINSGGVKVSPERIERRVEEQWTAFTRSCHERILPRFFVTGVPDERLGERVVLVIESAPASESEQQRLLEAVAAGVPRYYAPKEIRYVPRFAETGGGKVDRQATIKSSLSKS